MEREITVPILSDSHGHGNRAEMILQRLRRIGAAADEMIFLGDGTRDLLRYLPDGVRVYAVKGNCDGFGGTVIIDNDGFEVPVERIEFVGGKKLLLMHGHEYSVKSGKGLAIARGVSVGADVVLFGHTHEPYCQRIEKGTEIAGTTLVKDLFVFNPGALAGGSFGILTVKGGEILLSHGRIAD